MNLDQKGQNGDKSTSMTREVIVSLRIIDIFPRISIIKLKVKTSFVSPEGFIISKITIDIC